MSNIVSGPPNTTARARRPDLFLLLLLLLSLSLNVYLGWKVRGGNITPNLPAPVAVGTKVESIKAANLDGKPETISYQDTDKPTVLYVLSPSCSWCERNRENIAKLTERGDRFRFIGLSLSDAGLKEYVEKQQLKFPVYMRVAPEAQTALGLGPTPQTIVISPEGHVLKNWAGAYSDQTLDEIEDYFQIQLPGLVSN